MQSPPQPQSLALVGRSHDCVAFIVASVKLIRIVIALDAARSPAVVRRGGSFLDFDDEDKKIKRGGSFLDFDDEDKKIKRGGSFLDFDDEDKKVKRGGSFLDFDDEDED